MRRSILAVLAVLLLTTACQRHGSSPAASDSSSPSSSSTTAAASSSSSSGESIGVPECDDYLQAFRDCIASKVPEASQAELREALEQNVSTWRSAAASPEGRAGLAVACTQAREAAKPSVSAYGCSL
jgi:hypothetical protein